MDLTMRKETFGADDPSWRATRTGIDDALAATFDRSAFTKATHFPDDFLLSGIPVARDSTSHKYVPYSGSGSNGADTCVGFVLGPIPFRPDSDADPVGAVQWHGAVVVSRLPVALDAAGQADLAAHFAFVA